MKNQILNTIVIASNLIACQHKNDIGEFEGSPNIEKIETKTFSRSRFPTQEEIDFLSKTFPNLDTNNIIVTGEATDAYNCIAYSMGLTNKWINPERFYNDFVKQYTSAKTLYGAPSNFDKTTTGSAGATVDGWGRNVMDMTHGSVKLSEDIWESKLGRYLRISHRREELSGNSYGNILVSFVKRSIGYDILGQKELAKQVALKDIELSETEKQSITDKAKQVPLELKAEFENLFHSWKKEIDTNPKMILSSNTLDYTKLQQFKKMQAMGSAIIPLIMEKLLDNKNFPLLPLYDVIQTDTLLKITYKKNDAKILEGEQNRAKRSIRLWLESFNK